jgi:hypothetical protein
MKINVDAAVSRHGNHGVVAAICRDEAGAYVGASVLAVPGICDPATLEAVACREGLALAADLNLQKLQVSLDCLEVIKSIHVLTKSSYFSILREIDMRRLAFENVSFSHESRCSNTHAHNLVRFFVYLEHERRLWLLESLDIQIVTLEIE